MPTIKHITCTLEDCEEKHYGQGFCRTHYNRFYARKNSHKSVQHIEIDRKQKHDEIWRNMQKVEYNNFIIKAIPATKNNSWSMAIMKLNKVGELDYVCGMPALFDTADAAINEGIGIIKRGLKR